MGLRKKQIVCLIQAVFVIAAACSNLAGQAAEKNVEITDAELSEAKKKVPVHPWHKERVGNIKSETTREVIENLANFDDMHFAESAGSMLFCAGQGRSEVIRVVNLRRVRRLFEEGRKTPGLVLPLLRKAYKDALAGWPRAWAERIEAADGAAKAGKDHTLSEPDLFYKVNNRAVAATYLLAELKDYSSVPMLVEGYKLQAKWMDEFPRSAFTRVPVPTTMTLYAIHRLVTSMDVEGMSPEALIARKAYMQWAEEKLPPPTNLDGTVWDSSYDESDPYLGFVDPQGRVLRDESRIRMSVYPYEWKEGDFFEEDDVGPLKISEREKQWAKLLLTFAETTFPNAKSHQPETKQDTGAIADDSTAARKEVPGNLQAITDFGISRSEPIDKSFFFYKGKYIDAPYVVERRGLDIYVNGILISPGPEYPIYDYKVEKDPGDPPAGSSPLDPLPPEADRRDTYWSKKWAYLYSHYDHETAKKMMVATYKKGAKVTGAEWDGKDFVRLSYSDGRTELISLSLHHGGPAVNPPTKEGLLSRVEAEAAHHQKRFGGNQAIFIGGRGPTMVTGGRRALKMIEILLSEASDAEKIEALASGRAAVFPPGPGGKPLHWIVTDFQGSPQLEERFRQLKEANR